MRRRIAVLVDPHSVRLFLDGRIGTVLHVGGIGLRHALRRILGRQFLLRILAGLARALAGRRGWGIGFWCRRRRGFRGVVGERGAAAEEPGEHKALLSQMTCRNCARLFSNASCFPGVTEPCSCRRRSFAINRNGVATSSRSSKATSAHHNRTALVFGHTAKRWRVPLDCRIDPHRCPLSQGRQGANLRQCRIIRQMLPPIG